jgi:hypothetical protein
LRALMCALVVAILAFGSHTASAAWENDVRLGLNVDDPAADSVQTGHVQQRSHRHYLTQGDLRPAQNHQPWAWSIVQRENLPSGRRERSHVETAGSILPHPNGCPSTRFCGCGVLQKVKEAGVQFSTRVARDLWVAAEWRRFPRVAPAPGMVAIFRGGGHVAYIEAVSADGSALLYDPNSGGHLTRLHYRSLAGAIVVDPSRGG